MHRSKSSYSDRAKKFIVMVAPYIADCCYIWQYKRAINRFNKDKHRNVTVCYGISRIALITSDYVVKIDYSRNSSFGTSENELALYCEAVEDGYDYLFAAIERYVYNKQDFYIMPRIGGIGRTDYDIYEYLTDDENRWLEQRVFDLHFKNYGWRNNYPVIIDYAATEFEEDECSE